MNIKQFVLNSFMKNNSNPMFSQLIEMANKGDSKGVENFARNLLKERGMDFDEEFAKFRNSFKG